MLDLNACIDQERQHGGDGEKEMVDADIARPMGDLEDHAVEGRHAAREEVADEEHHGHAQAAEEPSPVYRFSPQAPPIEIPEGERGHGERDQRAAYPADPDSLQ